MNTNAAIDLAELARAMLTCAAGDARRLANKAAVICTQAAELEQRLRQMIADLEPRLAEVVAIDRTGDGESDVPLVH